MCENKLVKPLLKRHSCKIIPPFHKCIWCVIIVNIIDVWCYWCEYYDLSLWLFSLLSYFVIFIVILFSFYDNHIKLIILTIITFVKSLWLALLSSLLLLFPLSLSSLGLVSEILQLWFACGKSIFPLKISVRAPSLLVLQPSVRLLTAGPWQSELRVNNACVMGASCSSAKWVQRHISV